MKRLLVKQFLVSTQVHFVISIMSNEFTTVFDNFNHKFLRVYLKSLLFITLYILL